jgi:AraC-like DNA-binding protein
MYILGERMLYFCESLSMVKLNTAASVLIVGLEHEVNVTLANGPDIQARLILIPAGTTIQVNYYCKPVAYLYLDPLNIDYIYFKNYLSKQDQGISFNNCQFCEWLIFLKRVYRNQWEVTRVSNFVNSIIPSTIPLIDVNLTHLQTVKECLSLIHNPWDTASNIELAETLGSSARNLTRQFKSITGVTICRYRNWKRLLLVAQSIVDGASLTDASVKVGFFDSSHFSRVCHYIFGLKPSQIYKTKTINHRKILGPVNTR